MCLLSAQAVAVALESEVLTRMERADSVAMVEL